METANCIRCIMRFIPTRIYLYLIYYRRMRKKLNLRKPETYTEKLQWLKIHDRKPVYSIMVDKCEAKKYVAERIGERYIVPLIGVWDTPDQIDFESLPDQFVLKCTHNSGGLIVCRRKSELDIPKAKEKLRKQLACNYYWHGREWPYKQLKPRVIAEKYMEDGKTHDLYDYKFFTFGGVPKIVHIVSNRQKEDMETYGDFFDMDYNHLNLTMGHINAPIPPQKPYNFEFMKEFAAKLAEGTRQLRVDFYEVDGELYFGELTFFQDSGCSDVQPPEWDTILGSWIDLN